MTEHKLIGVYLGKVRKHCEAGQCKVFIPGVYPNEFDDGKYESLPKAPQITPCFAGCVNNNGVFSYPDINTTVACGFFNGDQNHPYIFGAILGSDLSSTQYDDVYTASTGQTLVHEICAKQTKIKIYDNGHINIRTFSDYKEKNTENCSILSGSQIDINGNGTIDIQCTNQVNIKSPVINIGDTETSCITLKAKHLEIDCQDQNDGNVICNCNKAKLNSSLLTTMKSQITDIDSLVHFDVHSVNIELDSSGGKTVIRSLTERPKSFL